ncbi:MAG TPA: copper amine oxidase N-terminal domain-containing protein [Bacillus bacterium]|nr:copper amine oxidase N-terminal domain-containing protein [Bacillus sp. (in: firmicutes)]
MKKIYLLPAAFLLSSSILSYSLVAEADDDHDKDKKYYKYYDEQKYQELDYKKYRYDDDDDDDKSKYYEKERYKDRGEYKKYRDHDDDDDDDDDKYEKYEKQQDDTYYEKQQQQMNVAKESWYKWSRSATEPSEKAQLPIAAASEISLKMNNEEPIKVSAIPNGSQLLVPVKEVAEYLGAKTVIYPNSEIIEINKDNTQLIVRNNSKVVYENMRKTPMQAPMIKKNDEYYLPISVLANGFGCQVNEKVTNNEIQLKGAVQL